MVFCSKECQMKDNARTNNERMKEERRQIREKRRNATCRAGELTEMAVNAKKFGYKSYGQYVAATEYPVKIIRKW